MTELPNLLHNKWIYYYRINIVITKLFSTLINEEEFFESEKLKQRWIANKKAEIMLIANEEKFKNLISNSSNNCWIEIDEKLQVFEPNQVKIIDDKTFININLPIDHKKLSFQIGCHDYCIRNIILPVIRETKTLISSSKKINNKILSDFYNILLKYNYNVWKLNNSDYDTYDKLDEFEKLQVQKMIKLIYPPNKPRLDLSIFDSYPVIPREELNWETFIISIFVIVLVTVIQSIFNSSFLS